MSQQSRFVRRLSEAGITVDRFIPVRGCGDKPKAPANDRTEQPPEEVGTTYGVELGSGLVVVDVDHPEKFHMDVPATLEVATPHSELGHEFYQVQSEPRGSAQRWGEFKTDGEYVLGPGSEITNCGKCDRCSETSPGRYRIVRDEPIATLDEQTIQELQGRPEPDVNLSQSYAATDHSTSINKDDVPPSDASNTLSDDDVLSVALSANDPKFRRLWNGSTSDYPSHSEADSALCWKLAFYTGKDSTQIDRLFRQSGLYREKWERDDYRDRTIAKAINGIGETYSGSKNATDLPEFESDLPADGGRLIVSDPTVAGVLEALSDLGEASSSELKGHDSVDRGIDQVRRALDYLESRDMVAWERSGRSVSYYLTNGGRAEGFS